MKDNCAHCGNPYDYMTIGDGEPFPICHHCRIAPDLKKNDPVEMERRRVFWAEGEAKRVQ